MKKYEINKTALKIIIVKLSLWLVLFVCAYLAVFTFEGRETAQGICFGIGMFSYMIALVYGQDYIEKENRKGKRW